MKFILKISIGIGIALLNACTSQQERNQHNIYSANTLPVYLKQVVWWKKMQDPMLDDLLAQALKYNNQILAAQSNVLQAQAQLKAAYNAWLPTVNASATGFYVKGWNTDINKQGPLANSPLLNINNLRVNGAYTGFLPDYSLNLLENMSNTRLSRASLAVQKANYMALNLSIISQTVGAYFNLLGQKEQLAVQYQLIHDLKKLYHIEEIRYKDGASDYSALATIDQEVANNRALIVSMQASIVQLENTLQLLTNHEPGHLVTHKTLNSLNIKNSIPSQLPAHILENRPDIMIAKENLIMADAHLGLAYAQFFPQISLTGLLGGSSIELVHLLKLTTGLGVAQVAAMMPIFNGVLYQQIQASKAGVRAAYYDYIQSLRAALADVDTSLTQFKKATEGYTYQQQAFKAAIKGLNIISSRYTLGFQDRRSAINAQLRVDHAKISLIQANIERFNSLVTVYHALAGGAAR